MAETGKDLFRGHQYVSLETYRKSGEAVRTPVWFAQEDGRLFVWTFATAGKIKRISRNTQVMVAPCDRTGNPLGPYIVGEAQVNPKDSPTYQYGNRLLDQKYGLLKKVFGLMGRSNEDKRVIIEIKLEK